MIAPRTDLRGIITLLAGCTLDEVEAAHAVELAGERVESASDVAAWCCAYAGIAWRVYCDTEGRGGIAGELRQRLSVLACIGWGAANRLQSDHDIGETELTEATDLFPDRLIYS